MRFGLRAHDEASHLAELSARLRSRRYRVFYELVAREIDKSFAEAQRRLGLHQKRRGWTGRVAAGSLKEWPTGMPTASIMERWPQFKVYL